MGRGMYYTMEAMRSRMSLQSLASVGMGGRETMVSRIIRADNMVVVSLVEEGILEILPIVMKELRVGSSIRQRVQ